MSREGEKKSSTSITDQPQGTIQITISAGDGVQGQMAGQLIFDQDSSFITDLLEMADRTVHGPIPIGQSEEIIEPPKPSPRHQQLAIAASRFRQPTNGESLYAGQDQCHYGQSSNSYGRPGGGCDYYSCNDPSTSDMYEELETGPESCVVTPRQPMIRTIDGKERMTAGCDQKSSNFGQSQLPLGQPSMIRITNGKERMAAGGEIWKCGDMKHDSAGYYQDGRHFPAMRPVTLQSYGYPYVNNDQRQSNGRLTSGYCYCNPGYPAPCGFGDCSKAPFGYCRTEPCPPTSTALANGGFDMGAHNQNMRSLVHNTQSNLKGLRSNLSCTTDENVNYVWDSSYSYYSAPWGSTDKNHYNASDRVYFEQKVGLAPCEKKEDTGCPVHPTTCPPPAPCSPPDDGEKCPIDLCGMILTSEAFTRAKKEQKFDTNMTGCSEMRTSEQDHFRRSVIPQTRDLPDALSFKENKLLQFASGQDQMQGEEMYSNSKQNHYFGRSTTYGNCFEKRTAEDRDLKRRLGCPIPLPQPTYGQFRCDLYPVSGGNKAAGPYEEANEWDTSFPKEEIFLHHMEEYETEQNNVGFSEVKNDQKEFKRTLRPAKTVFVDTEEACQAKFNKSPCEHRSCAGGDGEPKCMRETADAGCVEPEADEDEEEEEGDAEPPGEDNKFSPCSGQGNAIITKNFRTRRVDRDCSGTIEMLQTELDQENSHTTCWGASVYAKTGLQPKLSNTFDRMCVA